MPRKYVNAPSEWCSSTRPSIRRNGRRSRTRLCGWRARSRRRIQYSHVKSVPPRGPVPRGSQCNPQGTSVAPASRRQPSQEVPAHDPHTRSSHRRRLRGPVFRVRYRASGRIVRGAGHVSVRPPLSRYGASFRPRPWPWDRARRSTTNRPRPRGTAMIAAASINAICPSRCHDAHAAPPCPAITCTVRTA